MGSTQSANRLSKGWIKIIGGMKFRQSAGIGRCSTDWGLSIRFAGEDDAAEKHYLRAVALNPRLTSARMNLGNLRLQQAKYQEAIESYRQVQRLEPDLAKTNDKLGVACVLCRINGLRPRKSGSAPWS